MAYRQNTPGVHHKVKEKRYARVQNQDQRHNKRREDSRVRSDHLLFDASQCQSPNGLCSGTDQVNTSRADKPRRCRYMEHSRLATAKRAVDGLTTHTPQETRPSRQCPLRGILYKIKTIYLLYDHQIYYASPK